MWFHWIMLKIQNLFIINERFEDTYIKCNNIYIIKII